MRWSLLLFNYFLLLHFYLFIIIDLFDCIFNYLFVFTMEPGSVEMTGMRWSLLLFNYSIICFYLFIINLFIYLFICVYHRARVRGDDGNAFETVVIYSFIYLLLLRNIHLLIIDLCLP
jgi:hypothetical protein